MPPGSHARLEMELGTHDTSDHNTVLADAIVRDAARTGDTRTGLRRYSVELTAMSHADQRRFGRWLDLRRTSADAGLEEPTDLLLGGTRSLTPPVHERPTELTPVCAGVAARVSTRQVRATRARVSYDRAAHRLQLAWRTLDDLHADWLCCLSHGVLYVQHHGLQRGDALAIVAILPDGRRTLLSGRTSTTVRGIAVIDVSIGHAAHALLAAPARPRGTRASVA